MTPNPDELRVTKDNQLAKELYSILNRLISQYSPYKNGKYPIFNISIGLDIDEFLAKELAYYINQNFIPRSEVEQYVVHDKDCLCSQFRAGKPTDDGDYLTLFGYGSQEKWYSRNKGEKPECSCGLDKLLEPREQTDEH